MSHYAISDIHGCYTEFVELLNRISFSDEDILVLCGDYIDRGKDSYKMMRWMENKPQNVIMLCGNHEIEYSFNIDIMCAIDSIEGINTDLNSIEDCLCLYDTVKYCLKKQSDLFNRFDIYHGIFDLINNGATLNDLLRWNALIKKLPYYYRAEWDDNLIFVHAGYVSNPDIIPTSYSSVEEFYIYAREDNIRLGGLNHGTIIYGHTPTIIPGQFSYNNGQIFHCHNRKSDCNFYNIDCGCFTRRKNSHLCCLRIDDKKEFYV